MATNAEITHVLFRGLINAFAPRPQNDKYWRLNVAKAVPAWDEVKKHWFWPDETIHHHDNYKHLPELDDTAAARGELMKMTKEYLGEADVEKAIDACAQALSADLE